MSALSSVTSQAAYPPSKSNSSNEARFSVIEKRIAEAVKTGDISKDVGDSLTQVLQQVQDSIDQAAQSGGVSSFSPDDIAKMFGTLKEALAAAKEPAPPPPTSGVDITI